MQESGKHMQTTMTERDRGPARRRVLQGMAALGGGVLLVPVVTIVTTTAGAVSGSSGPISRPAPRPGWWWGRRWS